MRVENGRMFRKAKPIEKPKSSIELLHMYMWLCFQIQVKTKYYIIDVGNQ